MTAQRRAALSLSYGLLSAGLPALMWVFLIFTDLRDPTRYRDPQGGMAIAFCFLPLSLLGALAFGIPAFVYGWGSQKDPSGEVGPRRRLAGAVLSVVGLVLALGTCIGPQALAALLR